MSHNCRAAPREAINIAPPHTNAMLLDAAFDRSAAGKNKTIAVMESEYNTLGWLKAHLVL